MDWAKIGIILFLVICMGVMCGGMMFGMRKKQRKK